ncbi:MAG: histone deacetylase [Gemmatimonadales bacterium]|nr:MAG: histone deacetylase [Gemmatimonadales bacterium]
MKIFYCDTFVLPLPEGHRFPMAKYRLLRERVAAEGLGTLTLPQAAGDAALLRVHDAGYVERVVSGTLAPEEVRRIGFPWSPGLVERSRRSVGGTIGAARAALDAGASANLAGGTHHAFADRGEGFCVFNDVAVAIRALQATGRIRRAAVLDLDVHQGNGTAALFRSDAEVFTASVHGDRNFPFRKEPGDLDLPLPDGAGDDMFLAAVTVAAREVLERGRPDIVFYVAGADAFAGDRLGRLCVSREGLAERDALVVESLRRSGVPLAVVMGGGYAHDVLDTVEIHLHSVRAASRLARA